MDDTVIRSASRGNSGEGAASASTPPGLEGVRVGVTGGGVGESTSGVDDDIESVAADAEEISVVHGLRRRWRPIKEGPASDAAHAPIRIRLHRALSWMDRADKIMVADPEGDDTTLIFYWIALNALYGTWDDERRQPSPDRESLGLFIDLICHHDAKQQRLPALFATHRGLIEGIVSDQMLVQHFWRDPDPVVPDADGPTPGVIFALRSAVRERRMSKALDIVLTRVYFARCQLVHGGATCGGELNRNAVRMCAQFLMLFLPEAALIIIDSAWADDKAPWADLCYPPLR